MAKSDSQLLKLALKENERLERLLVEARDQIEDQGQQIDLHDARVRAQADAHAKAIREMQTKVSALMQRNDQLRTVLGHANGIKTASAELNKLLTAAVAAEAAARLT